MKDRILFEAEFVRATWDKPDLTSDEINLYINVCVDYIHLKNISSHIEKLNQMFNEVEDQQDMTVRLAEVLKSKTDEYDKCEKRMESLIKKLNGDRAERLKNRRQENATILSLVRNFQVEEERKRMIQLAEMQKKLVEEETVRLDDMDSWKARILGISKQDAT
jgi:phage gpG-like protein